MLVLVAVVTIGSMLDKFDSITALITLSAANATGVAIPRTAAIARHADIFLRLVIVCRFL
ncbi:MAG: hypothetical protein ACD_23C00915G0001 [uncultured bacterium]|nr:MAG: hypothetical protein ACD_23C00915G0001 [uncultured bacterium]